jgi:hypothetical protein
MLAVQAKVETLKKQGMPPAQIGQILQNEVLPTGAVPIAQLWQLMNYVKANSQATQAPPTDSVAVQLADKVKQMAMAKSHPLGSVPQMGQQAQPPFPPSGLPSAPPSAGPSPGISGLPASNMGQSYGGGGIVSFAGPDDQLVGDPTPDQYSGAFFPYSIANLPYAGIDPRTRMSRAQLQQMYATGQIPVGHGHGAQGSWTPPPPDMTSGASEDMGDGEQAPEGGITQFGPGKNTTPGQLPPDMRVGISGSMPQGGLGSLLGMVHKPALMDVEKVPTNAELTENAKVTAKELGLGSAAREANLYADKQEAKMAKDEKLDKNLALAQAGFAMAEAASRGGATFLGSASVGGSSLAQGLIKAKEKQDLDEERIENLKVKAAEAADQGNMGLFNVIMKEHGDARSEANATKRLNAQLGSEYEKARAEIIAAQIHASGYAQSTQGKVDPILQMLQQQYLSNRTPENLQAVYDHIAKSNATIVSQDMKGKTAEEIAREKNPFGLTMPPGWAYTEIQK